MSRFATVVGEVIEQSGRDTFNALNLDRQGIPCSPPASRSSSMASTPPPSWAAGSRRHG